MTSMFRDGLLKGKRILVTGGGTGLGKEMAEDYLRLGAEVYICGRRKNVLDDTAKALMDRHGGSVKTHSVDIRVAQAVDDMVGEIWADGGPLTGLVNNAAGNFISPTKDLSPRGFDAIANIVFHGSFYVTHAVGTRWIADKVKGSVISILTTWIWNGGPFTVPSAMSKAGINIMTKSLAAEWGLTASASTRSRRGRSRPKAPGRGCRPASRPMAKARARAFRWAASARWTS